MIVTVTSTIMGGQVVRWYADESAAEYGTASMSASRDGVRVYCFLHQVPDGRLDEAQRLYAILCDGREVPEGVATHRRLGGRRIEPIVRESA